VAFLFGVLQMSKEESLDLLMLLSAVESWAFSTKERMPDYLFEKIDSATEILRAKVLGGDK
jgi:hypothetical protein